MVRAPRPRHRVTLASSCLATALALAVIVPVGAARPSAAPETPEASEPVAASTATGTELRGAEAIAAGHERYVAVGTSRKRPVAWVSSDGVSWDKAGIAGIRRGSHMVAVTPTSDGFVALGYARAGDPQRQWQGKDHRILAWSSSDGVAWERVSIERPARRGFDAFPAGLFDGPARGLADGPAGLLALGTFVGQDLAGQRLWHSADGQAWEPAPLPEVEDGTWFRVVGVPSGYLLQGQRRDQRGDTYQVTPSNWHSADGVTWEELPDMPVLTDVAAAPDGTIVGIGGTDIRRSSDLVEWETVWSAPAEWASPGGETSVLGWVDWAGDRFLVTGLDHGACTEQADVCRHYPLLQSADGRTWSKVDGSEAWLKDVASDGDSTVVLSFAVDGRPATAWLLTDELLATTTSE